MFKRHLILFHSLFVCFILIYIYIYIYMYLTFLSMGCCYSERVRNFAVLKFFCSVFLVIFFSHPVKFALSFV